MEIERECGRVTEIKGNMALVETDPASFCMSCASKNSCPTGANPRTKKLWIENTLRAREGDNVYFYVPGGGVIASSLLIYMLPLVLLFAGIIVGIMLHAQLGLDMEASSGIFGIMGFGLSFVIIRLVSDRVLNKQKFKPKMLERSSPGEN